MDLSDAEIEATREPLAETLDFIESVESACVRNLAALQTVGGSVFIGIYGVGQWTLVTRGPRAGLYAEATDDEVHFSMLCEEWVLHELLDPDCEVDLEEYSEAEVFHAEGELAVFQRLLSLAQGGGGMVDMRLRE